MEIYSALAVGFPRDPPNPTHPVVGYRKCRMSWVDDQRWAPRRCRAVSRTLPNGVV